MNNKKVQFYPFHAINDFMRDDFRLEVVREALQSLTGAPEDVRAPIERLTRKTVQVPGFRNPAKAPVAFRLKPTVDSFSRHPQMCAAILTAWAECHPALRQQIYDLLIRRGWEVMPPDADRTKLPGFLIKWPEGEDVEILNEAYRECHPESDETEDSISLMAVWISTRLPYQLGADAKITPSQNDET